ncbi:hypothetical protein PoB_000303300 [Plakobranchus ocellatus]|uniref:Sushi domain-containing protein n=1 Tax=Plakobranchus ocellatus TaxID=259542 RepID=A0AAV3Y2C5_9GAST|nr:hypothetical protein PoB_000303300 [Plakobranchus ocellatus]
MGPILMLHVGMVTDHGTNPYVRCRYGHRSWTNPYVRCSVWSPIMGAILMLDVGMVADHGTNVYFRCRYIHRSWNQSLCQMSFLYRSRVYRYLCSRVYQVGESGCTIHHR